MREAAEAGADSLLIADVPSLEAEPFVREMDQAGHRAGVDRRRRTRRTRPSSASQAFQKPTLIASAEPASPALTQAGSSIAGLVDRLQRAGAPPPVFGFGISTPEHVRAALAAGAKGVICGSAIVELAARGGDVVNFVRSLKASQRRERLGAAMIESPRQGDVSMAARPIWRGQIGWRLVSIPVELYPGDQERRPDPVPPGPRAVGQAHQI